MPLVLNRHLRLSLQTNLWKLLINLNKTAMERNVKLWAMVGLASLPLLLAGCSNKENLYDPVKADSLLKEEYSAKFVAKYGEFSADYSWDATSSTPKYQSSRANGDYTTSQDYYEVESGTLGWLKRKLKDGKDNSSLGTPFFMTVPNNEFTIVPIFQGSANYTWKLHMVVGEGENAKDIEFWSKSKGIQYKKWANASSWYDLANNGNTENVGAVRSKQYTFDLKEQVGQIMYFYLEVWNGNTKVGNMSSLEHQMLALTDCPLPGNIDKKNEMLIIACEDASIKGDSDKDYNEVVLMVYGNPEVPKPVEITNEEVKEVTTKRYMIEDLGSTDDFDFNDVVVDVTRTLTKKMTYENGKLSASETISDEQKAVIRHLGGIVPFQLKIGNTTLEEMQGQMDVNPDTEFAVTGWDPDQNNVSATVKDVNNGSVHAVSFPHKGEAPMIIAVDAEVQWMEERVSITKDWFESIKK